MIRATRHRQDIVTIVFSLTYKHFILIHFIFNNLHGRWAFSTSFCRHAPPHEEIVSTGNSAFRQNFAEAGARCTGPYSMGRHARENVAPRFFGALPGAVPRNLKGGRTLLSHTFSDDGQPRNALKISGVVSYERVVLLESRRCNPCVLGGYWLCPAHEPHFTPPLADRMAGGYDHVRRDPGFEALNLFSAPPRTIRSLVKLGYRHERDRQGVPFDVGSVSLSQGMVFEEEGKHVSIKQEGAHGLASSRSSRRRA